MDGDSDRMGQGSNPSGGAGDHLARNPIAANLSSGTKEVLGFEPVTSWVMILIKNDRMHASSEAEKTQLLTQPFHRFEPTTKIL